MQIYVALPISIKLCQIRTEGLGGYVLFKLCFPEK